MSLEDLRRRYEAGLHGMQAGVALDEVHDPVNLTPKHLRVGVNSALVDSAALARCLIAKGLISELEYFATLADLAEIERKTYEDKYSARFGRPIRLV